MVCIQTKSALEKEQEKEKKMMLKIYATYDSKGQFYHNPFFKQTPGEAERDFRTAVNDSKTQLNQYPEDFDLFYLGQYDTLTGKLVPLATPEHIIKGIHCLKTQPTAIRSEPMANV